MTNAAPFVFYTERRLVTLTARTARNLQELLDNLETISGSAIFFHTHHQFLSHHFERPVFYNDFAVWAGRALQEDRLAEQLAAVDLLNYTTIRELREAIISIIRGHMESGRRMRECPPGDEFHFSKSKSFVMSTGVVAETPAQFFEKLPQVSTISLFFHFFEARLRLERPTNDFSTWLEALGEDELAGKIYQMNPYIVTLDELRDQIVQLGQTKRQELEQRWQLHSTTIER